MKRSKFGQIATAIIMTATAAIPIGTAYEILTHVPASAAASAVPSSQTSVAIVQLPSTGNRVVKKRKVQTKNSVSGSRKRAAPTSTPTAAAVARNFSGTAIQEQFGTVQAVISVKNKRITTVSISAPMDNPRSAGINSQAAPMLQSETLQAQSATGVNTISGATVTSQAYQQSLQAAITQAQNSRAL